MITWEFWNYSYENMGIFGNLLCFILLLYYICKWHSSLHWHHMRSRALRWEMCLKEEARPCFKCAHLGKGGCCRSRLVSYSVCARSGFVSFGLKCTCKLTVFYAAFVLTKIWDIESGLRETWSGQNEWNCRERVAMVTLTSENILQNGSLKCLFPSVPQTHWTPNSFMEKCLNISLGNRILWNIDGKHYFNILMELENTYRNVHRPYVCS